MPRKCVALPTVDIDSATLVNQRQRNREIAATLFVQVTETFDQ